MKAPRRGTSRDQKDAFRRRLDPSQFLAALVFPVWRSGINGWEIKKFIWFWWILLLSLMAGLPVKNRNKRNEDQQPKSTTTELVEFSAPTRFPVYRGIHFLSRVGIPSPLSMSGDWGLATYEKKCRNFQKRGRVSIPCLLRNFTLRKETTFLIYPWMYMNFKHVESFRPLRFNFPRLCFLLAEEF